MECHYHPERESTDNCAICNKPICKECGLEIAGKTYCKDCLEKMVGVGLNTKESETIHPQKQDPVTEPIIQEPINDPTIQETTTEPTIQEPINDPIVQEPIDYKIDEPIVPEKENKYEIENLDEYDDGDFIYPDHNHQVEEPNLENKELEEKYERYLDDLYYDAPPISLSEQLARDEQQHGSLTRNPYTPEKINSQFENENYGETKHPLKSPHNIHYKNEKKEKFGALDILLTITLILLMFIVIYYIIFLVLLSNSYPTFIDALLGLGNPADLLNNLVNS
jgi:hypothetical protein